MIVKTNGLTSLSHCHIHPGDAEYMKTDENVYDQSERESEVTRLILHKH